MALTNCSRVEIVFLHALFIRLIYKRHVKHIIIEGNLNVSNLILSAIETMPTTAFAFDILLRLTQITWKTTDRFWRFRMTKFKLDFYKTLKINIWFVQEKRKLQHILWWNKFIEFEISFERYLTCSNVIRHQRIRLRVSNDSFQLISV